MTIVELLQALRQAGVSVSLDDGKLRTAAPKGAITADLAQAIRLHRDGMIEFLLRAREAGDDASVAPIVRAAAADSHPLSFSQQRLWFIDRLEGRSSQYNLPMPLRLHGRLDRAALQRALDALVARHEVLRTCYVQDGDEPVQVVRPRGPVSIREEDLVRLDPAARDTRLAELMQADATQPFDLASDLMLRCTLVRLDEDEHALLFTMHHIASDGWSIGVLVREVGALYTAFALDLPDPLPELPIQYADYSRWQRHHAVLHEQVAFWKHHLDGAPALLELPLDRPRPPVSSHAGAVLPFALSASLSAGLRELSQRHGTTLFMTLLAGWSVLMSRLSGQDDVVIGTPVANRQRAELEPLIGFFVNTLALRVRLDGEPTVASLLEQVRQTTLDAYSNQDVPFEQVVEVMQPARSLSHSPLFQVVLTMNNTPAGGEIELPGLRLSSVPSAHLTTHFDLSLSLNDGGGGIVGGLEYATDLFDATTLQRRLDSFARLLEAMVADDSQRIGSLPLMDAAERERVLVGFNATDADYPGDSTVHAQFEAQVVRAPEAIALGFEGVNWSYAELNRRANRLAHRLLALGVQPDDRFAVCAPRSADTVVAMLAILKAGGAYVPLEADAPLSRLAQLIGDCEPVALLAPADLRAKFAGHTGTPPLLWHDDAADQPEHDPQVPGLHGRHLAYVIYTSGSTGEPKGVMVEHRSVLRLAINNHYAPITSDDCVAHCANPAFDASTWEVWAALLNGARLQVIGQDTVLDPASFRAALIDANVTALWLTVGLFNEYVDQLGQAFACLDHLLIGGDALDPRTVAQLLDGPHRPKRLVNGYGPTETTTFAVTHAIDRSDADRRSIPIGRPIANTRVYVLDAQRHSVPVGVPGELYIGGPGVARGYLKRPELTVDSFLDDPFATEAGARLYRTGDRVRWLADGTIEYLGRNDAQIKIRGFRVELGEIEARLAQSDGVRQALVIARSDAAGSKRLVAYVAADATDGLAERLRRELAQQLPSYMVPSAIVVLDQLPLTRNGKVDKHRLPEPELHAAAHVDPQGATEIALAGIWARVLKREQVSREADFFELGGHSLLATRVSSEVARTFGKPITVRALFEHSTLSELAAYVDAQGSETYAAIPAAPRDRPLPLSFAQQRLWFLDQLDHAAGAAYHIPSALRLSGTLDRAALQAALDRIVARHESLRTTFASVDGEPVQVIAPASAGFALLDHDLSTLDADGQGAAVAELAAAEAQAPFDLAHGPLIRGRLLRLGAHEHVLLVTQHHIISDGWSIGVLVREVSALYGAFVASYSDPLPALPIQYADYAQWQRQHAVLHEQIAFWKHHLDGAPALLELPLDRPRQPVSSHAGAMLPFALSPSLSAGLRELSQRHGTTLFMTLLAGWSVLMSRLSGQDDVVIGTPVANRQRTELEPLIGFFVNTLALRVRLDGEPTVASLLEQVRQTTLDAYSNQDVPFEQIVEAVQPARSLSHSPLFQVVLALNNTSHGEALQLPGLTLAMLEQPHVTAQFDMTLSLSDGDERIRGILEYATDLFDAATLQLRLDSFARLLEAMVADDSQRIGSLPLMDATERERVLVGFNDTDADYPSDSTVHAQFQAQVARTPEAIALGFDGQVWTYAELNRRTNRLAHRLLALGVQPDDRVAVCAPRSADSVVAMLAILKAGGAYVPLEADAPLSRLAQLIGDCEPVALLAPAELRAQFADHTGTLPLLWHDDATDQPEHDPQVPGLHGRHLAYVIYTSGSTGEPKGVMVEHRSILRLAINNHYAPVDEQDCVAHCANPAFDASTWEVWSTLLNGARLQVIGQDTVLDPAAFQTALIDANVTALWLTVGLFNEYVDQLGAAFAGLNHLLIGGDALDPRTVAQLLDGPHRPKRLVNGYGPTETTTFAVTHAIERSDADRRSIPIGRPIANTRVYVLDAQRHPVPVGVPGELYIGGPGVARGYLKRPELTVDSFLDDPFHPDAGARLYRTGDRVRWLADGTLEYLGRHDAQIKIRGFRVELGEIEARLAQSDGVRNALVIARSDAAGSKRLVAYVAAEAVDGLVERLRRELAQQLPSYMVPSAIVVLDQLPLTRNGKVDKRLLPEPVYQSQDGYVAPEGEVETALATIWQQVLRVGQVGVHDNFFEIGGDSILSIQVVSRANQAGIAITTKQLFEAQTIAELARRAATGVQVIAPQGEVSGPMALLPIQHAFLDDGDIDRHHFNQSVLLETPAGFTAETLHALVAALYHRHDALRLRFDQADGHWQASHAPLDAVMLAASGVVETLPADPGQQRAFIADRCNHWQASFDLAQGPLLRAVYFALVDAAGTGRLLLTAHHAVVDGVSWRILLADLEQAYVQHERGERIALPAKTSSFQQWGEALGEYARSPALQDEKAYWLAQAGQQVAPLPVDRAGEGFGTLASTRTLAVSLTADETRALLQQCNSVYRTQINELLLAGIYRGMRRWTGGHGLRLRLEGHGREALFDQLDVTGTVGWFTSVFPLTLRCTGDDTGETIKAVKEQLRSVPHHGIGYGVLRHLAGDPDLLAAQLAGGEAELEFNYLGQFDQVLNADTRFQAAAEYGGQQGSPRRQRSSRIGVSGMSFGGQLQLSVAYSDEQYDAATIQRLADALLHGLREVIAHCQQVGVGAYTPSDFPLARIDQTRLDDWQARYPDLSRVYPATPMQAGLQFHSLLDRSAYVVQVYPVLRGRLDPAQFRNAWEKVVARHDILRTAFIGEGEGLHQLVQSRCELPWHEEDLRGLDEADQGARFERFRLQDKQAGFDFARPPLMRIALFRLGEDRYQLLWTQHHILLDGWCLPLVYRDVMQVYYAALDGRDAGLQPAVPYERYIGWLLGKNETEARAHWHQLLADIDAPTPLAIDRLGGDGQGHREHLLELSAEATQALQALAKAQHTTVNTLMQWAWGYLLHRYSGESKVVFGATISGRSPEVPGIEDMVGLFINTIPVKVAFDDATPLTESLAELHRTFQRSNEYGYLSLTEIQRQSDVPAGTALFDSILAFENFPLDAAADVAATATRSPIELERPGNDEQTNYKLSLSVSTGHTLQVRLGSRREHFAEEAIQRLLGHLRRVLEQLPAAANGHRIELLGDEELAQLTGWNATAAGYPRHLCAHQLFEAQVERAPESIALVLADEQLSYGELNRRANRVARCLRDRGVGVGDLVGLCMQRSTQMIVGVLGILKAGAAYLPLDPNYPQERLAEMVEDAGIAHVLADADALRAFPWLETRSVLPLDATDRATLLAGYASTDILPADIGLSPSCVAYVIYTSGSTGKPKGVLLEHRGMVNLAANQQRLYATGPDSRVLGFASLSFDASAWEWLMALSSGASLHLCDEDDRHSTERLADLLVRQRITHATLPPALLGQIPLERDYALQALILAGEACEEGLAWRWAGQYRVFNAYGPSETTVAAACAEVRPGEPITLGRPLDNVDLHVIDPAGRVQPVGVAGELGIGGDGLARGYLDRPELTAERFVAHPWHEGARLYRTGDLGCRLPNGEVVFLGRTDDQVKIRGFRVELGEIESQLHAHPAVQQVVVVPRRDGGPTRLAAYVVRQPDVDGMLQQESLVEALRAHLRQRLPEHMVPAAFVVLDQLPLTRNGKVDKRLLPEPVYQSQDGYVDPEGEVETALAAIWQQVLRVGQVGVHDNFFEIGGDSILSIQVVSRANQAGIAITTKQLFEAQTIADLARRAATGMQVIAPQGEVAGPMALLPIQHAFLDDGDVDRHHFNQSVLLETPVGFSAATLHALVAALYHRHDALRLRFDQADGHWRAIHAPLDAAMLAASGVVETLPADSGQQRAFIAERCNHWQASFDLAQGPLLRAVYFAPVDAAGTGRLLLTAHHAVVDGVSWRILLGDLEQAYVQHERGERIALPAKTSSFQQWGDALREYAHSPALQDEKAYWLAQAGQQVAPLPVDRAGEGFGTLASTRTLAVSLTVEETRALLQQCNSVYRTQINELLLAGIYRGMRRWTGGHGLRLRLEGHGREALFDQLDVTGTVGWFTTVFPLTLRCTGDETGETIKAVKEQLRSVPHHGIGYGVLRHLAGDPDLLAAQLAGGEAELEFNYLGQFDQVLNADTRFQAAAEYGGQQGSPRRQRSSRIGVSGMSFGGQLQLSVAYSDEQYDATTVQRLADALLHGLREVIAHCQQVGVGAYTPSDFPLARIDQTRLDDWQARYPDLSRVYPATPMQAGLQFHSLLDRSAYVVQVYPVLRGRLDPAQFRNAWEKVVARHDILRTAFIGEGEGLHQLVQSRCELPWHEEDLRGLDEAEQGARFERFRLQDKQAGFDFARPPLMRIALFRLGEDRYQLLWTQHHILLDGWCLPLVYRDVMQVYYAALDGRDAGLQPAVPYERYIGWLLGKNEAEARAHWHHLLGDIDAPTPLAIDRLGGDGHGHREHLLELSAEATQALQALAKAQHTTVNTLMQWAWGYLLHRYSGESKVVFGATISGRSPEVPGIEDMVGLFINTIPVKVAFEDATPLTESLAELHRTFQRSNEYGYLSLTEIQRQSDVPAGTALFDSLLAFENYPLDAASEVAQAPAEAKLEMESAGNDEQTNYRLTVSVILGNAMQVKLGYRAEEIGAASVQRLAGHLGRILAQLPDAVQTGAPIELLDESEHDQLLRWSGTGESFDRDTLVHRQFEAHAARRPQAIALTLDGQSLSYGELNRRANQVAHRLIGIGVRPDDRVAICVERSFDMLVGLLGILKAGGAYVPLDPVYPPDRLAYMLGDSAPVALVTHAVVQASVPLPATLDLATVVVDAPTLDAEPDHDPRPVGLSPGSLAYVIYTSGSTGNPKGVMVEHGQLNRLFSGTERYFQFNDQDVWTLFHSFAFDFSVWEIWGALLHGGRLVVVPGLVARTPAEFYELLAAEAATVLNQTPSAFRALMPAQSQSASAHSLRTVIFGGEALELHTLVPWFERNGERTAMVNMYGITEITVHATYRQISEAEARSARGSIIGRALPDLQLHVLDAQRRPVPIGVTGELYVGGHGVARGYLNRGQLTAERFLPDPFRSEPGARLYRTGDLGRWLDDGHVEYLGRNDFQVKIRGFRIELGEIEARLNACPGIREAVVIAREDLPGDKRLVAYAVPEEGAALSVADLRAALSRDLADYMVPSAFVSLERLPLTANGKLDRQALPAPDQSAVLARQYEVPENAAEEAVAAIWQDLLAVERVGRNDDFFELGGHSLLAVRMLGELNVRFGMEIRIRDVFERTTVAALSAYLAEQQAMAALKDQLGFDAADYDKEFTEL